MQSDDPQETVEQKMAVVVDYQNMQITAAKIFLPGKPVGEALIDPYLLAREIARVKNASLAEHTYYSKYHVNAQFVDVYRGIPREDDDPFAYHLDSKQHDYWQNTPGDPVVRVTSRPLRYRWGLENGVNVPIRESRHEKGIDVLCALSLVRLARSGEYDIVVLASHDTDLAPALDAAYNVGGAKIEAVKWFDKTGRALQGFMRTEHDLWTTQLDEESFERSRDFHYYS